jgi:hypothetical protein
MAARKQFEIEASLHFSIDSYNLQSLEIRILPKKGPVNLSLNERHRKHSLRHTRIKRPRPVIQ